MTTQTFTYQSLPSRVVFGNGKLQQLAAEVETLGAQRVLVVSTPEQKPLAEQAASLLGNKAIEIFAGAVMHVPLATAETARELARKLAIDAVVAIGGGSTVGLAKAIALTDDIPVVAIPTTYAGSEMTPIYGITDGGRKTTGKDPRVLPKVVIYDPELSRGLPLTLSITSGMNAIAHAAEGLYAKDGNPIMTLMAEEGIRALAQALPRLHRDAHDAAGRADALYGAWLCGSVLGNVGMALHHKLCHTLGGSFNLPHAEVHTVVLPQAIAFNAEAAPEAMRRIERALQLPEGTAAASGLFDLAAQNGAPVALRDIGMAASDLDQAADIAVSQPYWNPRPVDQSAHVAIRELLQRAYEGQRP